MADAWTSQRTGDWSVASNNVASPWHDGGTQTARASIPAATDTITIATTHVVTYDTDNSAGAGFGNITITGTLICKATGGPYVLKTTGTIGGAGTLQAGTSTSSRLAQTTKFTIDLTSTGTISGASGLIVALYCSEPTHPYVKLTQSEVATTTQLHIDTDLTAETAYWAAGSPLVIADVDGTFDYQGVADDPRTLASIDDATHLTISAGGLDWTNTTGAYIVLATRNIEVQIASTNYAFTSVTNGNIYCSIRQTGASQVGRGLSGCVGCNVGGVLSGFQYGSYGGHSITVSGLITGNTCGASYGSGHTISGTAIGNTYAVGYGNGHTLSGTFSGNQYAAFSVTGATIIGTITGNAVGVTQCSYSIISGTITNNTYALSYGNYILVRGCVLGTHSLADVGNVSGSGYTSVVGHGAALGSTTQVLVWKRSSVPTTRYDIGTFLYDVPATSGGAPQIGQVKCWMPGGRIVSEAASGTPPITMAFAHAYYAEDDTAPAYCDWPLKVVSGELIRVQWYLYPADLPEDYAVRPRIEIIDPNYDFGNASSILGYDEMGAGFSGDVNAWNDMGVLSYVPTESRDLILRFRATAALLAAPCQGQFYYEVMRTPRGGVIGSSVINALAGEL